ncbi:hypothetical protein SEA_TAPIOCA_26 [Mycobacterium phage Tapioca]|uniref:Uncharacterized protein n=14 Tax=Caudoviricetes TaxID=2731619 RepID=G1FTW4_9CAUD|nr:hypothetical protein CL81_gp26 [Mycobacterium phage Charlie]YP_009197151.1 hypothetical protein AVV74_gp26 [Mycobacterium phage Carcharodon]YP_009616879.1 hypothetical protein FDI84_gp26 [Mycobacterium phage Pipsqueaks]YP_010051890.1 hypothetical protein KD928_gp26 [Mycobacterium phage Philonius]YP_010051962.1 hypothetical protein KD929_gp26 [Mycobacterium phage Aggie]YP_010052299.1 hypothetical protein KD934_gp26 [Mycobacterium phage Tapioca]YP_010754818.1 hypothetical protein QEH38_gp29 
MAIRITIHIVPDYDHLETGLWCPHCLKPSGYRLPLKRLSLCGVSDFGTLRKCDDCDASLVD